MHPTITVIVPAYNVEGYIERCIRSIFAQTCRHLEIIAIDDGSTDATGAILDSLAREDSRLQVVHQENAGLVAVRERGIALASGDYVGFVDGDDAVDPDFYGRLLDNLLETGADISHCGLRVYWDDGTTEDHYGTGQKLVHSTDEALTELLRGRIFESSLCNKLYRRDLLPDSCLDMTVQSNEDMLRNFVLFSRAKTAVYEDFCGYQYWSRKNSMSNDAHAVRRARQVIRARRCIADHAAPAVKQEALRAWLSSVVNAVNILTFLPGAEAAEACRECRDTLRANRGLVKYLIRRQQLAARLILVSLGLHRAVYRIYRKRS